MSEAFFSPLSPMMTGHRNWLMRCRLRIQEGVADPSYGALDTAMVETAVYGWQYGFITYRPTGMLSSTHNS